ncbi:hypothetical protein [Ralstonia syzygii]|uniref:Transmembrane protein n=1 Tax=Ralstonia syzygii R24 TaxID=907261 RepID=G3A7V1_9RALS|nr:hypothetical protein [Ralstonia syzygii]CCA86587.1 hypothetical protein RALSY_40815 [Ralstonia syzygii R24]
MQMESRDSMTRFDRTLPPSRRLFRSRFSAVRLAETVFGWLAKGTLALVGVALVVLSMLSGGVGVPDLPTTRKGWGRLLMAVMAVLGAYHAFK